MFPVLIVVAIILGVIAAVFHFWLAFGALMSLVLGYASYNRRRKQ